MSLKATLTGSQIKHLKIALQCLGRIGLITEVCNSTAAATTAQLHHRRQTESILSNAGSDLLLEGFPEKVTSPLPYPVLHLHPLALYPLSCQH